MWLQVWLYLGLINGLTFWAFADDKRRAGTSRRRYPERLLLQLAAAGGSPGALAAQQLFRHKTRKQPFATWMRVICAAHAALLGLALIAL